MASGKREPTDDFERFWQIYLRDHTQPLTRVLHFLGISIALAGIVVSVFVEHSLLVAAGSLLAGMAVLWTAHRFVEHNTPTAYKRLGWAIFCGARMYWLGLTGRLKPELEKAGLR
jgi:hypothetical protein